MDAKAFLQHLTSDFDYQRQVVHVEAIPAREARCADPHPPLPEVVGSVLAGMGIQRLYTHQAQALAEIRQGRHVIVVTGTASGKTLCYNLPLMETLLSDPGATALYLFPTKALAQDQLKTLRRMHDLANSLPLRAGTYDGDTPPPERRKLRDKGNLILTNPDMLHSGILPNHARWAHFFGSLRYVVVDEIHAYRGVFGSHVANVLRRLRRICAHYQQSAVGAGLRLRAEALAKACARPQQSAVQPHPRPPATQLSAGSLTPGPQFIACSATIANPKEHAERLTGVEMQLVDDDGSPRGRKVFVLWNPPHLDEAKMERRSPHTEAQRLLCRLVEGRQQTIAFVRARVIAELIYRYAQENLERRGSRLARALRAYRSGYIPEERREIERQLFSGELMGVVATNALELGIDIGSLDACLLVGYPGSIASAWQQAGRAGRGAEESLAVLIAYNQPIDQFLMHHPEYLFETSPEAATIAQDNPHILTWQLRCACAELPIRAEDVEVFGPYLPAIMEILAEAGEVRQRKNSYYWASARYPAADVALRNSSQHVYVIQDHTGPEPQVLGTVDDLSAFYLVHPQAVYLHRGETYFVDDLDIERKHAHVRRVDLDYFTQAMDKTDIRIEATERERLCPDAGPVPARLHFGDLSVTEWVKMFKKIKFGTGDSMGYGNLDLPPMQLETHGLWLIPPAPILQRVRECERWPLDGLLGMANVMVAVMPLFVMSDPLDLGSAVDSANTGSPTIFIYDKYPGGVGFSERAYHRLEEILRASLSLIENCECEEGCPSCVSAPVPAGAWAEEADTSTRGVVPDKDAAIMIVRGLLGLEPHVPRTRAPRRELPEAGIRGQGSGIRHPDLAFEGKPFPTDYLRLPEGDEAKIRRRLREIVASWGASKATRR